MDCAPQILHIGDNLAADFCGARRAGFQSLNLDRSGNSRVTVYQVTQPEVLCCDLIKSGAGRLNTAAAVLFHATLHPSFTTANANAPNCSYPSPYHTGLAGGARLPRQE